MDPYDDRTLEITVTLIAIVAILIIIVRILIY